jgi:hypothetical protein
VAGAEEDHLLSGHDQEVGTMTCQKCKGLMIEERHPELSPNTTIHRCINCGLLLDPLIQQNRNSRMRGKESFLHAA